MADQQQQQQQQPMGAAAPSADQPGAAAAAVTSDGRPVFRVDGVEYEITGLEPEDAREIVEELKSRQRDPAVMVAQELERLEALGLPAAQRDRLAQTMADRLFDVLLMRPEDRVPSPEDVGRWLNQTESGAAFQLYLMLRRKTPGMTREKAAEIMSRVGREAVLKRRNETAARFLNYAADARRRQGTSEPAAAQAIPTPAPPATPQPADAPPAA